MLRLSLATLMVSAASAGTPDNVSSRLTIHVSCHPEKCCVTRTKEPLMPCGVT